MAILRDYIAKHYYAIDFTLNEIKCIGCCQN